MGRRDLPKEVGREDVHETTARKCGQIVLDNELARPDDAKAGRKRVLNVQRITGRRRPAS
jgi:hypothetical protein